MIIRIVCLLAVLLLASCGPKAKPSAVPVSDKTEDAAKEARALFDELRDARKRLAGKQHVPQPELDDLPKGADASQALPYLRRELFELSRVMDYQPPATGSLTVISDEVSGTSANLVFTMPVAVSARDNNLLITNTGTTPIINPRLEVNGASDWFDVDALLTQALHSGMSDREKALALWDFVVKSRRHGLPAHTRAEMHDPVRYLNVYGYGFCDDSATALAVLARQAGLPARIWNLEGHVVPEIFFDNAWHVLDPDGEIYYLEDDGKTIADVETLQKRPDLIQRRPSPVYRDSAELARIYGPENNRIATLYDKISSSSFQMKFTLRPGEGLLRSGQGDGRYFSAASYRKPQEYGSGRLTYRPLSTGSFYQGGTENFTGLTASSVDGAVELMTSGANAELCYRFELPYPMLDGLVAGTLDLPAGSSVRLELSEDQVQWHELWSTHQAGPSNFSVPTTRFFRNGFGDPMYHYFVRLVFSGPARISNLTFQTNIQVAPKSLPALRAGDNLVTYHAEGSPTSSAIVEFSYPDSTNATSPARH